MQKKFREKVLDLIRVITNLKVFVEKHEKMNIKFIFIMTELIRKFIEIIVFALKKFQNCSQNKHQKQIFYERSMSISFILHYQNCQHLLRKNYFLYNYNNEKERAVVKMSASSHLKNVQDQKKTKITRIVIMM